MNQELPCRVPSATWLVADAHGDAARDEYGGVDGRCRFCGVRSRGVSSESVVNADYFNDDSLMQVPTSTHCCWACAYCLDGPKEVKGGQWIAHESGFEQPSTGDLLEEFVAIRGGEYDPPVAIHVTESPIRSSHAYLWTPVNYGIEAPHVAVDRRQNKLYWSDFEKLLVAVERLRAHGFRLADIRNGTPRVDDLRSVGRDTYAELDATIDRYRDTAGLELALILSRSRTDQPASARATPDHTTPIHDV